MSWAYSIPKNNGFFHQTINQSKNFLNLQIKTLILMIEHSWKHIKEKYGLRSQWFTTQKTITERTVAISDLDQYIRKFFLKRH